MCAKPRLIDTAQQGAFCSGSSDRKIELDQIPQNRIRFFVCWRFDGWSASPSGSTKRLGVFADPMIGKSFILAEMTVILSNRPFIVEVSFGADFEPGHTKRLKILVTVPPPIIFI